MVSFRKSILALAVLALFVGLASAQVGTPTGGGAGSVLGSALTCTANVAVPPQLRAEGVTELIGDIVIACTGGSFPVTSGATLPTVNITVSLPTQVTSRILSNGTITASEALLLIDEPGSGLIGVGPGLAQTVNSCPNSGAGAVVSPGTASGTCGPVFFNPALGYPVTGTTGAAFTTAAPNVYQGIVSGNQVTFNGIPILAPVTAGLTRVFRITNVRANAAGASITGLAGTTPLSASVAISGSTSLPVANPVLVTGFIQNGLSASVRSGSNGSFGGGSASLNFLQCNSVNTGNNAPPNGSMSNVLRFQENFATAFKTRVAPTSTVGPAGISGGGTYAQNIPGAIYNAESGFILNGGYIGAVQPGLADFGTRLRAVFTNIPVGVNVYVTTTNISGSSPATLGGTTGPGGIAFTPGSTGVALTTPTAVLVQTETAPDFNGFPPFINPTATNSTSAVYQVPLDANRNGVAVWEVVAVNPNAIDTLDFGVFFQFSASPNTGSPALGSGKVNLSFSPAPGLPGSTVPNSWTSASTGPIPRFVDNSSATTIIAISICQTELLFPFVTNENGFETGIAISNTSKDPFGAAGAQTGSCAISFYGDNPPASNTGTPTAPCTMAGACLFNTNADGTKSIMSGQTFANTLSGILGTGSFQGYAIAVCNFQFAHGFAFISDTHATNLAMGYLALVLNTRGIPGESLGM